MSDLLPTKEQETAALNACSLEYDTSRGFVPAAEFEDVALLLAEREAVLVDVICRLRVCLHTALMDSTMCGWVLADTREEGYKALEETVQYEVVK